MIVVVNHKQTSLSTKCVNWTVPGQWLILVIWPQSSALLTTKMIPDQVKTYQLLQEPQNDTDVTS